MGEILDSRQLRAFAALARTGSFTVAARELHLSQSAVSHAIKALEEQVGCRLFDRVGKKAALTQAGEQLQAHTHRILDEMARAREELTRLGRWGMSRLRIGASSTACEYILPAVLREFKESYPDCQIVIEPGNSSESIDAVRNHRVDLAIALEPGREDWSEFRPLFTDELQFVVNPTHPWAVAGRADSATFTRQTFVLYNKKTPTFRLIEKYFAEDHRVLPTSIELGSMSAIKELVKLGIGVGILAPWNARPEVAVHSLVMLPLGKRKLKRRWGIVHWRSRRLSLPEETFVSLCKTVAAEFDLAAPGKKRG